MTRHKQELLKKARAAVMTAAHSIKKEQGINFSDALKKAWMLYNYLKFQGTSIFWIPSNIGDYAKKADEMIDRFLKEKAFKEHHGFKAADIVYGCDFDFEGYPLSFRAKAVKGTFRCVYEAVDFLIG